MKHDGGVVAKGMLAERRAGKKVKVRIGLQEERDPFGREVGQVFVDCEDVGLWMVKSGYAFAVQQDEKIDEELRRRYEKAEKKAERKRLGFHNGEFEDPLEWVKPRIREQFEERGEDPTDLARNDEERFVEVARAIVEEIGEEMFVEWAAEAFLIL